MAQPNNITNLPIEKKSSSGDQSSKAEVHSSLSDVLIATTENHTQPNTMITDPKEASANQSAEIRVEEKSTKPQSTPNCKPNDSSTSLPEAKESKSISMAPTSDQDKKDADITHIPPSVNTSLQVDSTTKDSSFPTLTNQPDSHPTVSKGNSNDYLLNQTEVVRKESEPIVIADRKISNYKEDVTFPCEEKVTTMEVEKTEQMNTNVQEITVDIHSDTKKPPTPPQSKIATDCQSTQIIVQQPHAENEIKIVESIEHHNNGKRKMSSSPPQESRPLLKKQKQGEAVPDTPSKEDKAVSIEHGVQKLTIENGIKNKESISSEDKQQKAAEVNVPEEHRDKDMTDVQKLSFEGHIEVSAYGGHRVIAYVDGKELTGWVIDEKVLTAVSESTEAKQNGVIANTPSPRKKPSSNSTRRRPRKSPGPAVARRLLSASESLAFGQDDTDSGLAKPISSLDVPLRSVIVIGAGISGITAAKALSDRGFHVTVLEARSRLGGRIATDWSMGCPVDLGAAFIHGSHGNPLTEITREAGLRTYSFRDKGVMMHSDGKKVDSETDEYAYNLWQALLKRAQGIAKGDKLKHASSDVSLGRLLDRLKDEIVSDYDESVEHLLSWHVSNLETACAAELPDLSAKHYDMDDERGFSGSHKVIRDGFSSVVNALAKDLDIRYNSAVVGIQRDVPVQFQPEERSRARKEARNQISRASGGTIDLTLTPRKEVKYLEVSSPVPKEHNKTKSSHTKKSSAVRVVLQSGQEYFAESCIVTVPLGVLQRKMISFIPPLPRWKEEAAENIGFGLLNKVILRFSTPFWVDAIRKDNGEEDFGSDGPDYIGRVSNQQGVFFIFMSLLRPMGAPILVALSTGKFAEYIEEKPDDEIVTMAMKSLHKLFPSNPPSTLLSHKVTRWKMDKYARGSYSYAQVGTTPKDYTVMSEPVGDIYFAGEATHELHPATAHGAFMSGVREAARIIGSSNLSEELRAEYAEELRLMQDPRAAAEMNKSKQAKRSKSKTEDKPVANGSTPQKSNNRNSRRRSQR